MKKQKQTPAKNNSGNEYIASVIESYWQSVWEKEKTYQPNLDTAKKPFYNLMMFPYPSAEGLHVGSFFTYGGIDAFGRFKRLQGYDVFEPIGLDGFGIHSENYAMKVGRTPAEHARISEENFYRQLKLLGNSFDWSRTLETYDPDYYHWTQWLFVELFKAGLAYKAKAKVNFCPSCKTVLSDEQVIDGKCERCSSLVEKKELAQWFFRITDYAERLLKNTETLDWTEKVKTAQKNWIGKKAGLEIVYPVAGSEHVITVFTTRPDTNFGATFIALAPEHPLITDIVLPEHTAAVADYCKQALAKTAIERQAEGREKTGVFTGAYVVNPLNNQRLPVWVSDFVLMDFGTGAVVGVPGHDKRDFEFAKQFDLPIKRVVIGKDGDTSPIENIAQVQEETGVMIHSDFLDGMAIDDAITKMMDYIEQKGFGKRVISYHLRDWLISRQRYWGPPIPMIYCDHCAKKHQSWFTTPEAQARGAGGQTAHPTAAGWYPSELPVLLPVISEYKPTGGKSPLANYPEFYRTTCPECGSEAMRETDVSDTFLDSSWYFFKYLVTDAAVPLPSEKFPIRVSDNLVSARKKWLPVTSYIGGAEHAVMHLLYSRFITLVLHDLGYVDFEEPYAKFRANGLIIKDGAKMSKSKGNVINPDDYVKKFGADTLRTYLGFIGPFAQGGDFQDSGIEGIHRFLKRVWHLTVNSEYTDTPLTQQEESVLHATIKGVGEDMEALRFNTAIAKIMTLYNTLSQRTEQQKEVIMIFLQLLSPFAVHMTEALWHKLGNKTSIHHSSWPRYDESKMQTDTVTIAVQVNGKLRDTLVVPQNMLTEHERLAQQAQELPNTKKYLAGKAVKKVIAIPGKVINLVI